LPSIFFDLACSRKRTNSGLSQIICTIPFSFLGKLRHLSKKRPLPKAGINLEIKALPSGGSS